MRGEGRLLAGWRGGPGCCGSPGVCQYLQCWLDLETPHIIISLHQQQSILLTGERHHHDINTNISPYTNPALQLQTVAVFLEASGPSVED